MKKGFFKRNWDILLTYLITGIGFLTTFLMLQGCHDWGCLGLLMIAFGGIIISALISIVGIIRTFRNKMDKWRIVLFLPFIIGAIYWLYIWSSLGGASQ